MPEGFAAEWGAAEIFMVVLFLFSCYRIENKRRTNQGLQ
jgi:hypothetical protein